MWQRKKGVFRQIMAAFCCCIALLTNGAIAGWSAAAFPKIRRNELPFRLTLFQEAYVVNFYYIGTMLSPLPAGIMMDTIGRKSTLLLLTIFALTNWSLVTFASNENFLYCARLSAGLWAGGVNTVAPAFISEVLEPKIRGALSTLFVIMYFAGNLYEYVLGPFVSYFTLGVASGILSFFFIATFIFIPESPYFYMMKNEKRKAEASLKWLRGDTECQTELDSIQAFVKSATERKASFADLILNEDYRTAFIHVQIVFCIQKLAGLFTVMAYLTVILPNHVGPLTPDKCTLIIGFVLLLAILVATSLIDRKGRKPLFIVSNVGIIFTSVITGIWYFLESYTQLDLNETTFIPFLGILMFGVFFCLGVGPIASLYQGELLPANVKARASTVTTVVSGLASIFNTTLFALCASYIGMFLNFFLFGLVSVLALFYASYYFIETKGKSLQEIQLEIRSRKKDCEKNGTKNGNLFTISDKSGENV